MTWLSFCCCLVANTSQLGKAKDVFLDVYVYVYVYMYMYMYMYMCTYICIYVTGKNSNIATLPNGYVGPNVFPPTEAVDFLVKQAMP